LTAASADWALFDVTGLIAEGYDHASTASCR
jgi:hypothetical protein